jgi:hypothetical protein
LIDLDIVDNVIEDQATYGALIPEQDDVIPWL